MAWVSAETELCNFLSRGLVLRLKIRVEFLNLLHKLLLMRIRRKSNFKIPNKYILIWLDIFTEFIGLVWFMVFNATFNNISVISWRSVLLEKETGVQGENHWPVASHWRTLSHNVASSTPRLSGIRTQNFSGDRH